jgi:tetratricopeptide (TPR) repeat protein
MKSLNHLPRILSFILLLTWNLQASGTADRSLADSLFSLGNSAYEAKDYASAIQWYDSAAHTGWTSSSLEFNLGNACYKENRIAPALLHYERAARLSPNDEDIRFNLRIAQLKTTDKIDAMPEIFYRRWARKWTSFFSDSLLSALLIASSLLLFTMLTLYFFAQESKLRRIGITSAGIVAAILVTLWITADLKSGFESESSEAIVMEASSYVKSSPDEKGNDLFILHEGTKVEVLDELNDWKKIRIANGTVGWIKSGDIEMV